MLDLLFINPLAFFIWAIALIVAVTIHEFSHALVADKLGDPTPRLAGRLSLNPAKHLDPVGTIALLIARIGWGKPVPIDPYNLRSPRRDSALISLAGPGSNLILASLLGLVLKLTPSLTLFSIILEPIIILNVSLAIFNLLPVPPLDGSKILLGIVSSQQALKLRDFQSQYGYFLLILMILPLFGGASLVSILIFPIINFILNLLI